MCSRVSSPGEKYTHTHTHTSLDVNRWCCAGILGGSRPTCAKHLVYIRFLWQSRSIGQTAQNTHKYHVQKSQQSQGVEDAGPQLCQPVTTEVSESNKRWNRSSIQGWLNLTPHCPSPLELWFQLAVLKGPMAKLKKKQLLKLIHTAKALSSCISPGQGERTRPKYQARGGSKRCLHSQRKYVQY